MAADTSEIAGLADRYATALFELADERKALDQVAEDLKALRQMLVDSADLRLLTRSPLIGRDAQVKAIMALAEKAEFAETTRNFLGIVARNRRLFALDRIVEGYLEELAKRRGEITADVISAQELNETQLNALTDVLKQTLGAKVSLRTRVDPALIGGLVVRVGSRLIDSSLRSKLSRLERALKAAA